MRSPRRRRPARREIDRSHSADLNDLASRAEYVGSPEHKSYPSPAGPPSLRVDATKCDPVLHGNFATLTDWLQGAIRRGCVGGPWEGDFPKWVWGQHDNVLYEARQVVPGRGQYKGYALLASEVPNHTEDFYP